MNRITGEKCIQRVVTLSDLLLLVGTPDHCSLPIPEEGWESLLQGDEPERPWTWDTATAKSRRVQ